MSAMSNTKGGEPAASGRLSGKVALITGAAGNLGGSIVRRYLAEGATVVMSGRDAARTTAALDAALAGAPLPDAEDRSYRSRIYRGMSLTVQAVSRRSTLAHRPARAVAAGLLRPASSGVRVTVMASTAAA